MFRSARFSCSSCRGVRCRYCYFSDRPGLAAAEWHPECHAGDKELVHAHVLSDFAKADQPWLTALIDACAEALPLLLANSDDKYQNEVMRLAPAPKSDPRKPAADKEEN